jgi:uncharacterized membrane protein YkoI
MNTYRKNMMSIAIALLLSGATLSEARASHAEDLKSLQTAKISLSDAVGIAENAQSGTAIEADLDQENGKTVYDVTVVKDQKFYELRIDAETGDVLHIAEDKD